jgi:hypothetical protein
MLNWIVKGPTLESYLQACKDAVKNITTFKQDERLHAIFEHCPKSIADEYHKQIPEWLLNKGFTNDFYGSPRLHNYGQKKFSTSTLQYIGVLANLVRMFGSLDGWRIVEIGGGYGGQCRTITDVYNVGCYHIIDLPEVCELQRKYCQAECYTLPTGQQYDLVISNYALSEIVNNKLYIDEVVKKAKHGYLTCNTDFVQLDFEHSRVNDIIGERETNYILTW